MCTNIDAISCPSEGKIKDYFGEMYDSIYIALSPFIEPLSMDTNLFFPETYPNKECILKNCSSKTWNEVCKYSNIDNINLLDIALRSRIGGLRKEYSSDDLIQKIESLSKLVPPTEGFISPFIENRLLHELKNLGYKKLIVRSEHLDSINTVRIDKLLNTELIPYAGSFFTEDRKYYITTHWDSHYSIICSNNYGINELVSKSNLEGFYCNKDTEIYWSIRSPET